MAGSVNKVIIVGNLGKDPESRSLGQSGDRVVNLSVATSESWKDRNSGERKEKTEWHRVAIFNEHLGKIAEQYLRKGSKVCIEGQLQTRKWEKDGQDHYATEIVITKFRGELTLLDGKSDGDNGRRDDRGADRRDDRRSSGGSAGSGAGRGFNRDLDDDIPFSPEMRG